MAKQKGILKIEGTLGGMTFYKSNGEHLVREKGGVSGDRIANDPNFIRTRENNQEFGRAGLAGKLLRDSLRILIMTASDRLVTSRTVTKMFEIMKLDTTSARGERSPAVALETAEGKALLKGFDFNEKSMLKAILYKAYTVDTATGEIVIQALKPKTDIAFPAGATHISINGAMAVVNFATNEYDVQQTNVVNGPINNASLNVTLTPSEVPAGAGTKLYLLRIEFYQLVNGQQYPLRNGAFNSLAIIETA